VSVVGRLVFDPVWSDIGKSGKSAAAVAATTGGGSCNALLKAASSAEGPPCRESSLVRYAIFLSEGALA
jgi:hypothetical protein